MKKTDTVEVTAATAPATSKSISIRVAWGTWSQVYVSNLCSYTVTNSQHSGVSSARSGTTAASILLAILTGLFAITSH